MKKIYLVLFMIAIGFFIVIYGSREEYYPPITYDETKTPFQNKLMKYNYETNNSIVDKINMYIITGSEENLNFNKIIISKGNNITLNVKKDETFIISLPANRTVAAKWILKSDDSISKNLILEKEEWLHTFKPVPKNSTGVSYDRQFFQFKALSTSNIILSFEYTPNEKVNDGSENNYFNFKINANIDTQ